jgi:nitroreductase
MTGREPSSLALATAIASRRSIRSFRTDPVEPARVHALLRAAVMAPTAMHVEPWLFVVVQDRAMLKRISDIAKLTLVKEADLYRDLHDPSRSPKNGGFLKALGSPDFNVFYNAGTLVAICARATNPFVSADCWLAAENLMLSAVAEGLGTCCVGSALPGLNAPEVKAELSIPSDVTCVAAIVVGAPAALPPATARKEPVVLAWKNTH